MAQLPSQKEKIAKQKQRTLEYQLKIQKLNRIHNEESLPLTAPAAEAPVVAQQLNMPTSSSHTARSDTSRTYNTIDPSQSTHRSSVHSSHTSHRSAVSALSSARPKPNLNPTHKLPTKLSTLKQLLPQTDEVLQLYRAERAAEFINKQSKHLQTPILPPSSSQFKIRGNTTTNTPTPTSTTANKDIDMMTLLNTLKDTENQIEKLELKVGLHSKTKHYQRSTNTSKYNII